MPALGKSDFTLDTCPCFVKHIVGQLLLFALIDTGVGADCWVKLCIFYTVALIDTGVGADCWVKLCIFYTVTVVCIDWHWCRCWLLGQALYLLHSCCCLHWLTLVSVLIAGSSFVSSTQSLLFALIDTGVGADCWVKLCIFYTVTVVCIDWHWCRCWLLGQALYLLHSHCCLHWLTLVSVLIAGSSFVSSTQLLLFALIDTGVGADCWVKLCIFYTVAVVCIDWHWCRCWLLGQALYLLHSCCCLHWLTLVSVLIAGSSFVSSTQLLLFALIDTGVGADCWVKLCIFYTVAVVCIDWHWCRCWLLGQALYLLHSCCCLHWLTLVSVLIAGSSFVSSTQLLLFALIDTGVGADCWVKLCIFYTVAVVCIDWHWCRCWLLGEALYLLHSCCCLHWLTLVSVLIAGWSFVSSTQLLLFALIDTGVGADCWVKLCIFYTVAVVCIDWHWCRCWLLGQALYLLHSCCCLHWLTLVSVLIAGSSFVSSTQLLLFALIDTGVGADCWVKLCIFYTVAVVCIDWHWCRCWLLGQALYLLHSCCCLHWLTLVSVLIAGSSFVSSTQLLLFALIDTGVGADCWVKLCIFYTVAVVCIDWHWCRCWLLGQALYLLHSCCCLHWLTLVSVLIAGSSFVSSTQLLLFALIDTGVGADCWVKLCIFYTVAVVCIDWHWCRCWLLGQALYLLHSHCCLHWLTLVSVLIAGSSFVSSTQLLLFALIDTGVGADCWVKLCIFYTVAVVCIDWHWCRCWLLGQALYLLHSCCCLHWLTLVSVLIAGSSFVSSTQLLLFALIDTGVGADCWVKLCIFYTVAVVCIDWHWCRCWLLGQALYLLHSCCCLHWLTLVSVLIAGSSFVSSTQLLLFALIDTGVGADCWVKLCIFYTVAVVCIDWHWCRCWLLGQALYLLHSCCCLHWLTLVSVLIAGSSFVSSTQLLLFALIDTGVGADCWVKLCIFYTVAVVCIDWHWCRCWLLGQALYLLHSCCCLHWLTLVSVLIAGSSFVSSTQLLLFALIDTGVGADCWVKLCIFYTVAVVCIDWHWCRCWLLGQALYLLHSCCCLHWLTLVSVLIAGSSFVSSTQSLLFALIDTGVGADCWVKLCIFYTVAVVCIDWHWCRCWLLGQALYLLHSCCCLHWLTLVSVLIAGSSFVSSTQLLLFALIDTGVGADCWVKLCIFYTVAVVCIDWHWCRCWLLGQALYLLHSCCCLHWLTLVSVLIAGSSFVSSTQLLLFALIDTGVGADCWVKLCIFYTVAVVCIDWHWCRCWLLGQALYLLHSCCCLHWLTLVSVLIAGSSFVSSTQLLLFALIDTGVGADCWVKLCIFYTVAVVCIDWHWCRCWLLGQALYLLHSCCCLHWLTLVSVLIAGSSFVSSTQLLLFALIDTGVGADCWVKLCIFYTVAVVCIDWHWCRCWLLGQALYLLHSCCCLHWLTLVSVLIAGSSFVSSTQLLLFALIDTGVGADCWVKLCIFYTVAVVCIDWHWCRCWLLGQALYLLHSCCCLHWLTLVSVLIAGSSFVSSTQLLLFALIDTGVGADCWVKLCIFYTVAVVCIDWHWCRCWLLGQALYLLHSCCCLHWLTLVSVLIAGSSFVSSTQLLLFALIDTGVGADCWVKLCIFYTVAVVCIDWHWCRCWLLGQALYLLHSHCCLHWLTLVSVLIAGSSFVSSTQLLLFALIDTGVGADCWVKLCIFYTVAVVCIDWHWCRCWLLGQALYLLHSCCCLHWLTLVSVLIAGSSFVSSTQLLLFALIDTGVGADCWVKLCIFYTVAVVCIDWHWCRCWLLGQALYLLHSHCCLHWLTLVSVLIAGSSFVSSTQSLLFALIDTGVGADCWVKLCIFYTVAVVCIDWHWCRCWLLGQALYLLHSHCCLHWLTLVSVLIAGSSFVSSTQLLLFALIDTGVGADCWVKLCIFYTVAVVCIDWHWCRCWLLGQALYLLHSCCCLHWLTLVSVLIAGSSFVSSTQLLLFALIDTGVGADCWVKLCVFYTVAVVCIDWRWCRCWLLGQALCLLHSCCCLHWLTLVSVLIVGSSFVSSTQLLLFALIDTGVGADCWVKLCIFYTVAVVCIDWHWCRCWLLGQALYLLHSCCCLHWLTLVSVLIAGSSFVSSTQLLLFALIDTGVGADCWVKLCIFYTVAVVCIDWHWCRCWLLGQALCLLHSCCCLHWLTLVSVLIAGSSFVSSTQLLLFALIDTGVGADCWVKLCIFYTVAVVCIDWHWCRCWLLGQALYLLHSHCCLHWLTLVSVLIAGSSFVSSTQLLLFALIDTGVGADCWVKLCIFYTVAVVCIDWHWCRCWLLGQALYLLHSHCCLHWLTLVSVLIAGSSFVSSTQSLLFALIDTGVGADCWVKLCIFYTVAVVCIDWHWCRCWLLGQALYLLHSCCCLHWLTLVSVLIAGSSFVSSTQLLLFALIDTGVGADCWVKLCVFYTVAVVCIDWHWCRCWLLGQALYLLHSCCCLHWLTLVSVLIVGSSFVSSTQLLLFALIDTGVGADCWVKLCIFYTVAVVCIDWHWCRCWLLGQALYLLHSCCCLHWLTLVSVLIAGSSFVSSTQLLLFALIDTGVGADCWVKLCVFYTVAVVCIDWHWCRCWLLGQALCLLHSCCCLHWLTLVSVLIAGSSFVSSTQLLLFALIDTGVGADCWVKLCIFYTVAVVCIDWHWCRCWLLGEALCLLHSCCCLHWLTLVSVLIAGSSFVSSTQLLLFALIDTGVGADCWVKLCIFCTVAVVCIDWHWCRCWLLGQALYLLHSCCCLHWLTLVSVLIAGSSFVSSTQLLLFALIDTGVGADCWVKLCIFYTVAVVCIDWHWCRCWFLGEALCLLHSCCCLHWLTLVSVLIAGSSFVSSTQLLLFALIDTGVGADCWVKLCIFCTVAVVCIDWHWCRCWLLGQALYLLHSCCCLHWLTLVSVRIAGSSFVSSTQLLLFALIDTGVGADCWVKLCIFYTVAVVCIDWHWCRCWLLGQALYLLHSCCCLHWLTLVSVLIAGSSFVSSTQLLLFALIDTGVGANCWVKLCIFYTVAVVCIDWHWCRCWLLGQALYLLHSCCCLHWLTLVSVLIAGSSFVSSTQLLLFALIDTGVGADCWVKLCIFYNLHSCCCLHWLTLVSVLIAGSSFVSSTQLLLFALIDTDYLTKVTN